MLSPASLMLAALTVPGTDVGVPSLPPCRQQMLVRLGWNLQGRRLLTQLAAQVPSLTSGSGQATSACCFAEALR